MPYVYAIDFDGTLCDRAYPSIGAPKTKVINWVKERQAEGHKLILWTCRTGAMLTDAEDWCASRGLTFDAVNANIPGSGDDDPRKVSADYYLDDKAITVREVETDQVPEDKRRMHAARMRALGYAAAVD